MTARALPSHAEALAEAAEGRCFAEPDVLYQRGLRVSKMCIQVLHHFGKFDWYFHQRLWLEMLAIGISDFSESWVSWPGLSRRCGLWRSTRADELLPAVPLRSSISG